MTDQELSRMASLESIAQRYADLCDDLRAKLSALRAAADRAHVEVGHGGLSREAYDGLRAAIEASK